MRIEVFYFRGCPHRSLAVEEMERALAFERIQAEIVEIEIRDEEDAVRQSFYGSPTIRINGHDVAPIPSPAATMGLQCRLYPGGEHPGVPPRDSLRQAVRRAAHEETH
jgi:glutaredoxin